MNRFRHFGEKIVLQHLQAQGYDILEHNKIIKVDGVSVEIDIICFHPKSNFLHFIEVKSWNQKSPYIHPVIKEIQHRKEKILKLSYKYIQDILLNLDLYSSKSEYNNFLCHLNAISPWEISISFDLIWINNNQIKHFRNIFST